MTNKNKQPEPDKAERIKKHMRREDGKHHKSGQVSRTHANLKPNERDHNYNYLKHLDDYEEDYQEDLEDEQD